MPVFARTMPISMRDMPVCATNTGMPAMPTIRQPDIDVVADSSGIDPITVSKWDDGTGRGNAENPPRISLTPPRAMGRVSAIAEEGHAGDGMPAINAHAYACPYHFKLRHAGWHARITSLILLRRPEFATQAKECPAPGLNGVLLLDSSIIAETMADVHDTPAGLSLA
ncbi:hypothetical protein GGX14DRAFT_409017 [Mycena pura]|uniref:Uncharacterized protein n=1 Tax=Mycena pura TaxID=153505 RepID=A0AAD6UJW0_9AGAR|nr:hypothetical protein GGX14DRAFT_409017 [Mycena pura]